MGAADMPYTGLRVLLSNDTITAVSLGNPGVSQSWNYASLLNHFNKVADYQSTSATAYASTFPTSNIYTYGPSIMFGSLFGSAPVGQVDNGYIFWKSDNTGLWMTGFRPDSGPLAGTNVQVTPQELIIGSPASYGSVFNNSARWELPIKNNTADIDTFYVKVVKKVITADACGSLTTPYSTYPNILREHEYVTTIDSVYIKLGSNIVTTMEYSRDTLNNYIYLSNGVGYPVCIVHADKHNVVKDVEYYSGIYSGIDNSAQNNQPFTVYPNPSNGKITVEIAKNSATESVIFLYNSVGSLVMEKNGHESTVQLDLSSYPKGIYFIKVLNGNQLNTQKIVIQ
jgi:hypothetical protein